MISRRRFSALTLCSLALGGTCGCNPVAQALMTALCRRLRFFCLDPCAVHAAGAKVKDLEDEADRLLEKLQPIKRLQDNLRRNISQIKELINQARKQANSVSSRHFPRLIVFQVHGKTTTCNVFLWPSTLFGQRCLIAALPLCRSKCRCRQAATVSGVTGRTSGKGGTTPSPSTSRPPCLTTCSSTWAQPNM